MTGELSGEVMEARLRMSLKEGVRVAVEYQWGSYTRCYVGVVQAMEASVFSIEVEDEDEGIDPFGMMLEYQNVIEVGMADEEEEEESIVREETGMGGMTSAPDQVMVFPAMAEPEFVGSEVVTVSIPVEFLGDKPGPVVSLLREMAAWSMERRIQAASFGRIETVGDEADAAVELLLMKVNDVRAVEPF